MRRLAALAVVAVAALGSLLLACSDKQQEPFRDAPRGETNDEPADVFTMPDGFSNGASKCDHGNRVYVVFHGNSSYGSIDVVPQDPTCPQPTGQD